LGLPLEGQTQVYPLSAGRQSSRGLRASFPHTGKALPRRGLLSRAHGLRDWKAEPGCTAQGMKMPAGNRSSHAPPGWARPFHLFFLSKQNACD